MNKGWSVGRKHTGNIFCSWCYFIPEVESLDVNTTGHLQTDTIIGIFVLEILYIFQHLIFYLNINTLCFDICVFNYNLHFISSISHFEEIYRYD